MVANGWLSFEIDSLHVIERRSNALISTVALYSAAKKTQSIQQNNNLRT